MPTINLIVIPVSQTCIYVSSVSSHAVLAIRMCEAFTASKPTQEITHVRPFVYVSAEDFHRPAISVRYIETKLEAERKIDEIVKNHPQYRAVHVRPCELAFSQGCF